MSFPEPATARRDATPAGPTAPAVRAGGPADVVFTVTAYVNTARRSVDGYRTAHTVAEVTALDGSPLRLVFDASQVGGIDGAAGAAFHVSKNQCGDDRRHQWPADVRSLSTGDVLAVTTPDGVTAYRAIDSLGFAEISPPAHRTVLAGGRETSRRALRWQPGDLAAAAQVVGSLLREDAAFDHPSGAGDTTTLRLHSQRGPLLAEPGDWLVRADTGVWHVVSDRTLAPVQPSAPVATKNPPAPRDR